MADKRYLGDGVYIEHDLKCAALVIYTFNGVNKTNQIYLEPKVCENLKAYLEEYSKALL